MTMQPHSDTHPQALAAIAAAEETSPPRTAASLRIADLMPRSFDDLERVAKFATESGLAKVDNVAQAQVIVMTGLELGLTPMQALRGIYVVEGKPFVSADTMKALVYQSGLLGEWTVVESTEQGATIRASRKGRDPITRSFTKADADRAKLGRKKDGTFSEDSGHGKYPRIMLLHRCEAIVARELFPDVILGMYAPEERDEIEGTVVEARSTVVESRPAKTAPTASARDWAGEIAACETVEALTTLGATMRAATKDGTLPAAESTRLSAVFKARKAELSTAAAAQTEPGEAA